MEKLVKPRAFAPSPPSAAPIRRLDRPLLLGKTNASAQSSTRLELIATIAVTTFVTRTARRALREVTGESVE